MGGVIGPVLLMVGLMLTPASSASLLLNLEGVLTAALAWFAFYEHLDRRIVWGMILITLGGIVLSWEGSPTFTVPLGPLAVVGARLCWAVDNNLTRKISSKNPVLIAGVKGLIAGLVNLGLTQAIGIPLPGIWSCVLAGTVGLLGYGVRIVRVRATSRGGCPDRGLFFVRAFRRGDYRAGTAQGSTERLVLGGRVLDGYRTLVTSHRAPHARA